MLAAPNALMITGGPTTVTLAVEVLPVPPSADVACTLMDTPQDALEARVPADTLTWPDPATPVAVPPQELVRLFGVATTRPAGRLSVNDSPLSATAAFGLVMLKVSEVVPFSGIAGAPNALVIVGGLATVRFAVAVLPVPPLVELT